MTTPRQIILFKRLDHDGCLGEVFGGANDAYRKRHLGLDIKADKWFERFYFESHFGQRLITQLKDPCVKKIIFVSFSNRYKLANDVLNREGNFDSLNGCDGGSALGGISLWVAFLKKKLAKEKDSAGMSMADKIEFDPRTIWTIWHNQPIDTELKNASKLKYPLTQFVASKSELKKILDQISKLYGISCTDEFKVTMDYGLMHSLIQDVRKRFGEVDIIDEVYDDKKTVLNALDTAFTFFPDLYPESSGYKRIHLQYNLIFETENRGESILRAPLTLYMTKQLNKSSLKGRVDANHVSNMQILRSLFKELSSQSRHTPQDRFVIRVLSEFRVRLLEPLIDNPKVFLESQELDEQYSLQGLLASYPLDEQEESKPIAIYGTYSGLFFKRTETIVSDELQQILTPTICRIKDESYTPNTPVETLFARLTATYLLTNAVTDDLRKKAEAMIKKTSTNPADYDRLLALSKRTLGWVRIHVIQADTSQFCEYQLNLMTEQGIENYHFHARYQIKENLCVFIDQKELESPHPSVGCNQ